MAPVAPDNLSPSATISTTEPHRRTLNFPAEAVGTSPRIFLHPESKDEAALCNPAACLAMVYVRIGARGATRAEIHSRSSRGPSCIQAVNRNLSSARRPVRIAFRRDFIDVAVYT